MQLIEIIQLTLLIIVAFSAIILLFSYMGYRNKSNVKEFPESKSVIKNENIQKSIISDNLIKEPDTDLPQKSIKPNPKFEVFTPTQDNNKKSTSENSIKNKSHFPHILTIKDKSKQAD